eukprot:CAMPEP_0181192808 /NCGR_PEP_ID=MMETSP1096-20121128/13481_1 /TAXON_ID=156174 ORGANISM="Chrysochromulina ericina, Strain CCMP281" /NCGR_SAMPLE_ID=MMETSP1096 /ASSEMBLY_ACC=CAM_ASM_000453 /LENGTH=849 /DNA_ID=CAMNT_0023282229 /DNA_START=35 /DNA_END=2584 /DNA_ORIENTATION=-
MAEHPLPMAVVGLGEANDPSLAFSPPATRKSNSSSDSSGASSGALWNPPLVQQLPTVATSTPSTGEDCGVCTMCLDKPKFGGKGIKRKGCLARRVPAPNNNKAALQLIDSVARQPALSTPPLSEGAPSTIGSAPVRGVSKLSVGYTASSLSVSSSLAPASGTVDSDQSRLARRASERERTDEPDSPPQRKDYSLRKRGAAAGEMILEEATPSSLNSLPGPGASGDEPSDPPAESVGGNCCMAVDEAQPDQAEDLAGARPAGSDGQIKSRGAGMQGSPPGPADAPASAAKGNLPGGCSTPMLKTPELVEVAAGGALGMSPLSEFANLLDMTPRIAEQPRMGGHGPSMSSSPLFQLASLMEKTPKLTVPGVGGSPAEPEELSNALLNSSFPNSPNPSGHDGEPSSCGQLRRDLSRALLQAGHLASPAAGVGLKSGTMMPPPSRKRSLETQLVPSEVFDGAETSEERVMLRELLDGDSLGLQLDGSKPSVKNRSKQKDKEKGKPKRCRCDRSGCLKRYCVCFAAGNMCAGDCKCKGCANDETTDERKEKREEALKEMQKKKPNAFISRIGTIDGENEKVHTSGCNCKKSGCRKRYCECFQAGVKCTEKCKCCECHNPAGVNPLTFSKMDGATGAVGEPEELMSQEELLGGLPSPGSALVRHTPAFSPSRKPGSPSGTFDSFSALGSKASALLDSPFGGKSPFAAVMTGSPFSPSVKPSLIAAVVAAAAADDEPSAFSFADDAMIDPTARKLCVDSSFTTNDTVNEDGELPSSPDDIAGPSVGMQPESVGPMMPAAKTALATDVFAADTPEPRVGSSTPADTFSRDPASSTPSPPMLDGTAPSLDGCVPAIRA